MGYREWVTAATLGEVNNLVPESIAWDCGYRFNGVASLKRQLLVHAVQVCHSLASHRCDVSALFMVKPAQFDVCMQAVGVLRVDESHFVDRSDPEPSSSARDFPRPDVENVVANVEGVGAQVSDDISLFLGWKVSSPSEAEVVNVSQHTTTQDLSQFPDTVVEPMNVPDAQNSTVCFRKSHQLVGFQCSQSERLFHQDVFLGSEE